MAEVQGIEPQFTVLETVVFPLHHTPIGDLGKTRTCNLRLRRPLLYPVELRGHNCCIREGNFNPTPSSWNFHRGPTNLNALSDLRITITKKEACVKTSFLFYDKKSFSSSVYGHIVQSSSANVYLVFRSIPSFLMIKTRQKLSYLICLVWMIYFVFTQRLFDKIKFFAIDFKIFVVHFCNHR